MAKNAFTSQTILSCLGVMFAGGISLANDPSFYSKAANCADQFGQNRISELLRNGGKVLVMVLPLFGIAGRVKAGGLWTPRFLPGPKKEDVIAKENPSRLLLDRLIHQEQAIATTQQAILPLLQGLEKKLHEKSLVDLASLAKEVENL